MGRDEDGRRVYFQLPRAPFGAMAERTPVPAAQCIAVPDDVDDATAAAIANPGMSSWAALVERAKLRLGETVLINGATGAAGSLAVRIARHLGAGKVIVTGRDAEALGSLRADDVVHLSDDTGTLGSAFQQRFADGVDVVLDYLWGPSAHGLLVAGARSGQEGRPIRFIQIGSARAPAMDLPAAVLRSSSLVMFGSGLGSVGLDRLVASIAGVLGAAQRAGLTAPHRIDPLKDVEVAWGTAGNPRLVVRP